jgi:hypothetical protein
MVAALNAFRPQALTAYATVAAALAEEQLQGRLRIAPTLVATTSEVQTADIHRRITQAWDLEPLDFYGTTEAAVVAAARQGQAGMDVLEDLVVVEVVDEHDRPVPPGVPGHKVLLTNLVNHTQPLLRYELTDSLTLAGGPNPLGLPYARIAAVDGRSDDVITLPGAGGRPVAVPLPAAGTVRGAAGGPPVPGRPRPGRAARGRGAARAGPGRPPRPDQGVPGRRTAGRWRGPASDRGHPGPRDRARRRPRRQAQAGPQRGRAIALTGLRPG